MSTYNVRIVGILTTKNAKASSYTVRWKVTGEPFRDIRDPKVSLVRTRRTQTRIRHNQGV